MSGKREVRKEAKKTHRTYEKFSKAVQKENDGP
jgi:hypothetical protein